GRMLLHHSGLDRVVHRTRLRAHPDAAARAGLYGMLSASDTIRRLGGVARGTHLQTIGFTRRALSRCVRRGEIHRIRDGVFAVPPVHEDVWSATAHGGALTCASVLRMSGVWVLESPEAPHVWLGPGHHAHAHAGCRCISHFYRGIPPLGRASLETALL